MADEGQSSLGRPWVSRPRQLEDWLRRTEPPPEICLALIARAALRALPYIAEAEPPLIVSLATAAFRATALARVFAEYPRRANAATAASARDAAAAAGAAAGAYRIDSNPAAGAVAGYNAAFAAYSAARFAAIVAVATTANATAADVKAARCIGDEFGAAAANFATSADISQAFWRALEEDAALVESGVLNEVPAPNEVLANVPLWYVFEPAVLTDLWRKLISRLPADQGWGVWANWYNERLTGVARPEDYELIFATVPDEKWDEGPAAANAWIAERLTELRARATEQVPQPLEGIPSLFTFGENQAGQIDIVSGPQDTPVISYAGDENTHRQFLDTARKLAQRLLADLAARKFGNLRRDYEEGLERYIADIPDEPGEGNFLLADAEIICVLDLCTAEAAIVPTAFVSRLNRVLNSHFALLDFYPIVQRYHQAAPKGRLSPPLPEEAFSGFAEVVRKNSPETFAPRVTIGLQEAGREAPRVELDDSDRALHADIALPRYPYEHDSGGERRFGKAGAANALYQALLDRAKDPEKALAMMTIAKELSPNVKDIIGWLEEVLRG